MFKDSHGGHINHMITSLTFIAYHRVFVKSHSVFEYE